MTPLLFEVCSGSLEPNHCSFPVRAYLRTTRFVEATIEGVDFDRRVVHLTAAGDTGDLPYDQLVLAMGARTNRTMVPGSEHAFTIKNLADALLLRNHIIERFERADVERSPERKREQLTIVIIGGGLVGVELHLHRSRRAKILIQAAIGGLLSGLTINSGASIQQ